MRSATDLRGGTPLVSFNHVIDPHFVTFSNPNPTVITDPQIGPIDPQFVTVQIRILSRAELLP